MKHRGACEPPFATLSLSIIEYNQINFVLWLFDDNTFCYIHNPFVILLAVVREIKKTSEEQIEQEESSNNTL